MRHLLAEAIFTILTLIPPSSSLSFPIAILRPASSDSLTPPTRKWVRGNAKVALHALPGTSHNNGNPFVFLSSTSKKGDIATPPSEHRVISNICDANAQQDFAKCYEEVKVEVGTSVAGYCKLSERILETCKRRAAGESEGGCAEEEKIKEGCAGLTYSTYAYCLTYSYSGLTSIIHCANAELSLLPPSLDDVDSRPLLALRTPATATSSPMPSAISYYTNNSIGFVVTSAYPISRSPILVTPTLSYRNTSMQSTTQTTVASTPVIGGAGRNGTFTSTGDTSMQSTAESTTQTTAQTTAQITAQTTAQTTAQSSPIIGGAGRNGTGTSIGNGNKNTTMSYPFSTFSMISLPTIIPSTAEPGTTPAFGEGNRVGVFTTNGNVCTRYVGVATVTL